MLERELAACEGERDLAQGTAAGLARQMDELKRSLEAARQAIADTDLKAGPQPMQRPGGGSFQCMGDSL